MDETIFKILLVEDDELDQMAFRRMLEREKLPYDCTIAGSLLDAQQVLNVKEFDVIISDYSLGDGTALDVLSLAKDVPVILVTGADDRETAVKMWRAGAYDYLTKDVEREYLKTIRITIENAVKQHEMIKLLERKRRNQNAVFDAVPVCTLLIDENMTVLRVNRAVKEMVGKEYLEIINRLPGNALGCVNSVADETQQCGCSRDCGSCLLRKSIKEVFTSAKAVHGVEIPLVLMVGGRQMEVWFSVSVELVNIDDKKCAVVAMDDITSRKKAEEEIKHLSSFPQLNPDPILEVSDCGSITFCNAAASEALTKLGCADDPRVLLPADMDNILKELKQGREPCVPREVEINGTMFAEVIHFVREFNSVRIYATDITERKESEAAIKASEERYRIIFEEAANSIVVLDGVTGQILDFNAKAHETLGYSREEFKKLKIADVEAVESPEDAARHIEKIMKAGADYFETKHRTKTGEILDIRISCKVITLDGRRLLQSIWSDITAQKNVEKRLKETMELKSQFISTVSHELRTPLTCIKEAVSVVLEGMAGEIDDRQRHFLDIVKRNIERLAMLINDVLDFQRLEAGRTKMDISENDIREVVKSIDETMNIAAKKKGLDFAVELDGNLPRVWCDGNKIIQVLTNLISNAIKFTPQGGSVTVSIFRQGQEMVMRVRDTGMGIPKESLTRIFERFYRVARPGKEIRGTGLGLSIVSKIVDLHRGRIEVESEPGKETTFTVLLPLDARTPREVLPQQADEIIEASLLNDSTKNS